ncbi:MAG: c-type cytochrome [Proteobacteria bacterium]|nr:c-type cytochrome [Pseudomonadota bacterium]
MGRLLISLVGALFLLGAAPGMALAQDAAQGRAVFQANCAVCHQAVANGHAMVGPNLFGIVGRRAASAAGFAYSPAMQHANLTWTTDQLSAFVQAPTHVVPGTRMPFAGLHNPQQVAALTAYLATLH